MARFDWTDDLNTGNAFIDGDHRKLVGLMNAYFDALEKGQARDITAKVLHNLIVYAGEHFGREEAEMQRIHYFAATPHKAAHAQLLKQVHELKANMDAGRRVSAVAVAHLLGDWLRDHILCVDKKLAAALRGAGPPTLHLVKEQKPR